MKILRTVLATLSLLASTFGLAATSPADNAGLASRIAATASDRKAGFIEARRWFHRYSELSNHEFGTAGQVRARRFKQQCGWVFSGGTG